MRKRMMKKIAALALSAVMALSLAACGGGAGSGTSRRGSGDGAAADASSGLDVGEKSDPRLPLGRGRRRGRHPETAAAPSGRMSWGYRWRS